MIQMPMCSHVQSFATKLVCALKIEEITVKFEFFAPCKNGGDVKWKDNFFTNFLENILNFTAGKVSEVKAVDQKQ